VGKSVRGKSKNSVVKFAFIVIAIAAVGFGAWKLYEHFNGPSSGRYVFSFTEKVEMGDSADCVHLTYYGRDYCIDDWNKVYSTFSAADKATSSTLGDTVKFEFDADFHTGSIALVGDTEKPAIILDKVYSATATKQ